MRISDWSSDVCSSDLHSQAERIDGVSDRMRPSRSQPPPSPVRDLHRAVRRNREPPKEAGRMPRRALRSIFIVMAPSQTVSGNGVERHDRRFLERAVFVDRSEEHTSELQSLMRISYAV